METRDNGIDLLLRLKDDTFRVVQVKYRYGNNAVKDARGAYAMWGRSARAVGVENVKLIWVISNGASAPHYNEKYDEAGTYVPTILKLEYRSICVCVCECKCLIEW